VDGADVVVGAWGGEREVVGAVGVHSWGVERAILGGDGVRLLVLVGPGDRRADWDGQRRGVEFEVADAHRRPSLRGGRIGGGRRCRSRWRLHTGHGRHGLTGHTRCHARLKTDRRAGRSGCGCVAGTRRGEQDARGGETQYDLHTVEIGGRLHLRPARWAASPPQTPRWIRPAHERPVAVAGLGRFAADG